MTKKGHSWLNAQKLTNLPKLKILTKFDQNDQFGPPSLWSRLLGWLIWPETSLPKKSKWSIFGKLKIYQKWSNWQKWDGMSPVWCHVIPKGRRKPKVLKIKICLARWKRKNILPVLKVSEDRTLNLCISSGVGQNTASLLDQKRALFSKIWSKCDQFWSIWPTDPSKVAFVDFLRSWRTALDWETLRVRVLFHYVS